MTDLPWQNRTRQQQGAQTEKRLAKKKGARLHPMSGAGSVKDDMSTDTELIEAKDANVSHTIKGSDLMALYRRAVRQGKEPKYIITFGNGIVAEVNITKE